MIEIDDVNLICAKTVALYPRSSLLPMFRAIGRGATGSGDASSSNISLQWIQRCEGMSGYFDVIFVLVDFFKCYSQLIFRLAFL
jgi:hypothetical protein